MSYAIAPRPLPPGSRQSTESRCPAASARPYKSSAPGRPPSNSVETYGDPDRADGSCEHTATDISQSTTTTRCGLQESKMQTRQSLVTRSFAFRPTFYRLNHNCLAVFPEYLPQRIRDLPPGCHRLHGFDDPRHQVFAATRPFVDCTYRRRPSLRIAPRPELAHPLHLAPLQLFIDLLQRHRGFFADKLVHSHLDRLALIHSALIPICGVLNLALHVSMLDRAKHSHATRRLVEPGNSRKISIRRLLDLVGQRLHVIRPCQRIDGVNHAAFVCDHLLCSQSDSRRLLSRQRERLVEAIRVQALRPAQHRGQRLQCSAHNIVLRLLRGERRPRSLRMEPQRPTLRLFGTELFAHNVRPHPPRRTKLRNLFQQIVMRVEEKA